MADQDTKKTSSIEVADILKEHIGDYLKKYKIPKEYYKIIQDIISCRTAALGGHIEKCDHCDKERNAYNSCRNRHCPKCQTITKEKWLQDRKRELLPTIYFHNVFTLPHELNPIVLCNKKVMLDMLFKVASKTLQEFGQNPDNGLGGKIGLIALLHTWDQKLNDHNHLHCLIPGGALNSDDNQWIPCKNDYLFSVKALSEVFQGKFLDYFKKAYKKGELFFSDKIKELGTSSGFKQFLSQLWSKKWVVYIKKPIKNPERVLEYMARYSHKIAISNHRIISLENGKVTFKYKNRKTKTSETLTLNAVEFIRRFILHFLPKSFVRIRSYGFLANCCKKAKIKECRKLLGHSEGLPEKIKKSVQEMMLELTGTDITLCPFCKKGTMHPVMEIPKAHTQILLKPERSEKQGNT